MKLSIDLDNLGAEPEYDNTPDPLDETMALALESEKGIRVDFASKKEAEAMRFRFYRRIKQAKARGVTSYSRLVIQLDGKGLKLTKMPDMGNITRL